MAKATAKILEGADREHLLVFFLNSGHRIIGYQVAAVGTLDRTPVHPREVFKAAILASSAAIVVAHNHPTGDPTPSTQDQTITGRLRETGKILGIPLLDHIVVGHDGKWESVDPKGSDAVWDMMKTIRTIKEERPMSTSEEANSETDVAEYPPTFREWLTETLGPDQMEELAEHGADTGWPGLSMTSDLVALYHRYRHEIRAALNEDAEALGYDSPEGLVATFRRSDMLWTEDGRRSLLVWYLAERTAREITEGQ